MVLSWYENLPRDEVPPEYLWEDSEGLEMWWNTLEARRETGSKGYRQDEANQGGSSQEMADNDLARFLKE